MACCSAAAAASSRALAGASQLIAHAAAVARRAVRQAFAHAIDKNTISRALGGYPAVIDKVVVPLFPFSNPDVPTYEYNVEEANRLLDEADYPRGDDGVRVTGRQHGGGPDHRVERVATLRLAEDVDRVELGQLGGDHLRVVGPGADQDPLLTSISNCLIVQLGCFMRSIIHDPWM